MEISKGNNLSTKIASPIKRLLISIADCLLLLILGVVTFSTISVNIIGALPSFKEKVNEFNNASDVCLNMYYDSHLGVKNGSSNFTNDELAYTAVKNYLNDKFYDDNSKLLDNTLYFYSDYSVSNNLTKDSVSISKTISYVNINIYKYGQSFSSPLWDDDLDTNKPLKLSSSAKSLITDYINGIKTTETTSCFTNFKDLFVNGLTIGQKDLVNCDQYQGVMKICDDLYPQLLQYYSISALINYVILYIVLFILIPNFSSGGQTLMKRLFKISCYDAKTLDNASKKKLLLRNIIGILFYFPVIPLFAIPAITSTFLYMPLFIVNGQSFYLIYFVLGFFVLSLASVIVMFIDKKHREIHDFISNILIMKNDGDAKKAIIDEYEERLKENPTGGNKNV